MQQQVPRDQQRTHTREIYTTIILSCHTLKLSAGLGASYKVLGDTLAVWEM